MKPVCVAGCQPLVLVDLMEFHALILIYILNRLAHVGTEAVQVQVQVCLCLQALSISEDKTRLFILNTVNDARQYGGSHRTAAANSVILACDAGVISSRRFIVT